MTTWRTARSALFCSTGLALTLASAALAQPQAVPSTSAPARDAATSVGEVVVTAPREEVRARIRQENAPNIINVQSAETIAKYPDFNAAESLGRVPGVSLTSDTGEGRFVTIRGIDPNLNGATYGGIVLLNTNPGGTSQGGGGRAVEFDTVPNGAIDGIILTKSRTPDSEGEGIGGSIELTPRNAKNTNKPFLDFTLGDGYEPLHGHDGPFNADFAAGGRFGFRDGHFQLQNGTEVPGGSGWISNPTPFAIVLTASTRQDRRAIDDVENDFVNTYDGSGQLISPTTASDYQLRRYDYHRRRFGFGGSFEFTPNDNHSYYVRAANAGYIESVHKNFLVFNGLDGLVGLDLNGNPGTPGFAPTLPGDPNFRVSQFTPPTAANQDGIGGASLTSSLTDEQETHRNQVYAAGGRDQFGDLLLDYHVAYSRATFDVGRNIGANFVNSGPVAIAYDNVTNSNAIPNFRILDGTNVNDPSRYTLNRVSNSQEHDRDEETSAGVNLQLPLRLVNDTDRLKFGLEARIRDKAVNPYRESYSLPGNVPISNGNITETALSTAPNLDYYGGAFSNGPFIDRYAIGKLISSGQVVLKPGNPLQKDSVYRAQEDVYAGYFQYTTKIGDLGVLAGVRVEGTDGTYGGYVKVTNPVLDASGAPVLDGDGNPETTTTQNFQNRKKSYTNAFPTIQLRYDFAPNLVGRASWTTGIARPGFNQNNNATTLDNSAVPVLISRGNPNLEPITSNNFDLDLAYYLPNGGVVEIGAFDKELENYIIQRIQIGTTTDPFSPGVQANVTTYSNIKTAYVRGVEVAYNQKFTFLPGIFKGFGFDANFVYNDSQIKEYDANQTLTGQAEYGLLPGTSRFTGNGAIFYEANGIQARIAAQYVGHSLFGLSNSDKSQDVVLDDRLTLDFNSSYQVTPNLAVYFQARNLTDEPLRYYQENPNRQIQREFYDVTLEGGIKAHF